MSSMRSNPDVLVCRAGWMYHMGRIRESREITSRVLSRDPHHRTGLELHLAACVAMHLKQELFTLGHRLVAELPKSPLAWYAVGCYYLTVGRYDAARRHLAKCTSLPGGGRFAPGWVAYGHSFAALDESDQALAAYRSAARRFRGLHHPLLGTAIEYQRTNHHTLSLQLLREARRLCRVDPMVGNELGVGCYREGKYADAIGHLQDALKLLPEHAEVDADIRAPVLVNLGHCYRKLRQFERAKRAYQNAYALAPRDPGVVCSLAFVDHLQGDIDAAIEGYHRTLLLLPTMAFAREMLTVALQEQAQQPWDGTSM